MTEPDFLAFLLGVWRADIESVEFPQFADLLIPGQQQRPADSPKAELGGDK